MRKDDFKAKVNAREYEVTYKGHFIAAAGISDEAPNPKGHNARKNIEDNRLYAEMLIEDILSGKDRQHVLLVEAIDKVH